MKPTSYLFPIRALAFGALLFATSQCSVSEQVKESPSSKKSNISNEAKEDLAYDQMQFRLNFMDEAKLGGQDILFVRQASDFTPAQQAKLQTAQQANNLPLRLRMRVYARNSSQENIQLKQLDYQVLLDGKELTKGVTGTNTELESSAIVTLPIAIDMNVPKELTASSTPAAFAAGLADFTGSGRRLTMRVRPTYVSASGRVSQPTDFQTIDLVTAKRESGKSARR
ncbi:hypothetical protein ACFQT0_20025 [Hymenobacter humi]|uniref:Lipoprotein n=1 Tax=Hymenobacter humi TaxID=1411620 RepID=A0ABW2U7A8_9BACT